MKWAAGLFIVICSLFPFLSWGIEDATSEATLQIHRVLSGRIYKILEYRLQGLLSCDFDTHVDFGTRFKNFPKFSANEDTVLDLIDFYNETYHIKSPCLQKLNEAENVFHRQERQRFLVYNRLSEISKNLHDLFLELDPNCESAQVSNKAGFDSFPCMAGEKMLERSLTRGSDPVHIAQEETQFLEKMKESILASKVGNIDLYKLFLNGRSDSIILRERFLAMVTVLTASSSALGSYIQEYHFYFFNQVLLRSNSAEQALSVFDLFRLHIDQFRTLLRMARAEKKNLMVYGNSLNQINHHDVMAAFMACYYRDRSEVYRQWLPVALGYAYESYGLKSHIVNDKMSLKDSVDEFKIGTSRHQKGMKWGTQFCTIK